MTLDDIARERIDNLAKQVERDNRGIHHRITKESEERVRDDNRIIESLRADREATRAAIAALPTTKFEVDWTRVVIVIIVGLFAALGVRFVV